MINYDFTKGWKPFEGGKIPTDYSNIPEDLKNSLIFTEIDGKRVYLAGSAKAVEYLEEKKSIPFGWRVYVGGMFTSKIPKAILDAGVLKVQERDGKEVVLAAPSAFYFVECFNFTPVDP